MRMIIANRLSDGLVVFLTESGQWSVAIGEGVVIRDAADEERLFGLAKAAEADCVIVDPNLIDVTLADGAPRPVAIREAIRAFGPTI